MEQVTYYELTEKCIMTRAQVEEEIAQKGA